MKTNTDTFRLILGDAETELKTLLSEKITVDAIITSPPYFKCRNYNQTEQNSNTNEEDSPQAPAAANGKELGQEENPEKYILRLCDIMESAMALLKTNGTCWVVIGDSVAKRDYKPSIKKKESIGIPWLFAFEMRKRGFYIRQELIWAKKNPMPNSVKDMCVPSHESIFLITKTTNYYFDVQAIEEQAKTKTKAAGTPYERFGGTKRCNGDSVFYSGKVTVSNGKRRKRDVWKEPTAKCKSKHAAAYPEALILPCVLASTKENECVLDPFNGTGTTGVVALKHKRTYIGVELYQEHIDFSRDRLQREVVPK